MVFGWMCVKGVDCLMGFCIEFLVIVSQANMNIGRSILILTAESACLAQPLGRQELGPALVYMQPLSAQHEAGRRCPCPELLNVKEKQWAVLGGDDILMPGM